MSAASEGFVAGYIECALWSSTDNLRDDGGDPLDDPKYDEKLSDETRELMRKDCDRFVELFGGLLASASCSRNGSGYTKDAQAGHDFWLNRNGHGAGFWDGDWFPHEAGESLSQASKTFGEFNLYVGDDGRIYGE